MMESILIVCEGNICRSPMAEAMLRQAMPGRRVASAGLNALVGMPAAPYAQEVMRMRGFDVSTHRAQQIGRSLCTDADLILVMDRRQRASLRTSSRSCGGACSVSASTRISTCTTLTASPDSCSNAARA